MKPRSHASRFAGYIIMWTQDLKTDFFRALHDNNSITLVRAHAWNA